MQCDLVIRGGTVHDGTGQEGQSADVGIRNGRIESVGAVDGRGEEEIDAHGMIVTPGFIDIHTHYDGQATWANSMEPSSSHGVTTAIMGNCGVGFAPCRASDRESLVHLMEGVEDIPEVVMTAGLPWNWESYPEYLDSLDSKHFDIDIGGLVPHAALRMYVMGRRAADLEPATREDVEEMQRLLRDAMNAGAFGVGTSRTAFHRSSTGAPMPTFRANIDELRGLVEVMEEAGRGVLEFASNLSDLDRHFQMMAETARGSEVPLLFNLAQVPGQTPEHWHDLMTRLRRCNEEGLNIKAEVFARGIGFVLGHEMALNPFVLSPTYRKMASLPLPERLRELRKSEVRTAILTEPPVEDPAMPLAALVRDFERMFPLGEEAEYEPIPESSVASQSRNSGLTPEEWAYDYLMGQDGRAQLFLFASNYESMSLDEVHEMMLHEDTVLGLGDGGAHCGTICDASYTTFMLTHWVRDRTRGPRLPLPWAIRAMTSEPAHLMGLNDRGVIAPGLKADLNVIDLRKLRLHPPHVVHDMPEGGRRLLQKADGYVATIVSGVVARRNGEPTGLLPGRLVRSADRVREFATVE